MALRPLNSIAGFSTGDPAVTIIQANGDINTINFTANGLVNLGNVGNVNIGGGSNGEYLKTDGAGNLSWDSIGNISSNRAAPMPYLIPTGESYIVNENFQGLYSQAITIDGELEVDGILIEVPISFAAEPTQILFADNGNPTGNSHFTFDKITGNVIVPGDILPHSNVTQNLGSSDKRWNDIWLSNSTIYIGNSSISTDANTLVLESGSGATITVAGDANTSIIENGTSNITIDLDSNIRFGVGGTANVLILTSNGIDYDGNLVINGNITANGGNITGNVVTANTANIKNALINISLDVEPNAAINFKDANGNVGANILLVDDDILINNGNIDLTFGGGAFALANASNSNNNLTFALFDDGADILINGNAGNLTFGGGAFVLAASASLDFADGNGNILGNILLADDDILINTGPAGNLVFGGGAFVMTQANSANGSIALLDDDILINTGNGGNLTFGGGAFVANIISANANVSAGNVKTDHLLYANGTAWNFGQDPGGSNTQIQFNDSGNFAGSANFTFDSATNNLTVTGNVNSTNLNITGNGVVGGNLVVNGNLVYVNVEELSIEDPIINLNTGANGAAPVANSGKDVGSALNYYDTQARVAFMGWDTSNAEFAFGSQTSITSEVVTFTTLGNVRALTFKGNIEATTISGNLTTATQSNITTVGTLGSLSVTANINTGNVVGANVISANYLVSNSGCVSVNGAVLAFDSGTGAAGIFNSLATDINFGLAANITMGSTAGNVTARGNLIANNISTTGNISANLITGTLTTASQANITTIGTLGNLSVTGNTVTNIANANTTLTQSVVSKRTGIPTTVLTVVDSFSTTAYRTAKYVVSSQNDDGYESLEVLLIHNDINSFITVYAAINDGGGNTVTFSTGINSGNVELRATGLAANTVVNLIGTYVPD